MYIRALVAYSLIYQYSLLIRSHGCNRPHFTRHKTCSLGGTLVQSKGPTAHAFVHITILVALLHSANLPPLYNVMPGTCREHAGSCANRCVHYQLWSPGNFLCQSTETPRTSTGAFTDKLAEYYVTRRNGHPSKGSDGGWCDCHAGALHTYSDCFSLLLPVNTDPNTHC